MVTPCGYGIATYSVQSTTTPLCPPPSHPGFHLVAFARLGLSVNARTKGRVGCWGAAQHTSGQSADTAGNSALEGKWTDLTSLSTKAVMASESHASLLCRRS